MELKCSCKYANDFERIRVIIRGFIYNNRNARLFNIIIPRDLMKCIQFPRRVIGFYFQSFNVHRRCSRNYSSCICRVICLVFNKQAAYVMARAINFKAPTKSTAFIDLAKRRQQVKLFPTFNENVSLLRNLKHFNIKITYRIRERYEITDM